MGQEFGADADIRRGRHAVHSLHAHLVFVTKYRRGALTSEILDTCEDAMRKVCEDFGAALTEFEGEDDHVHLLIEFPPTVQLSKLINSLKGVSSRQMRKLHDRHLRRFLWDGHLWSRSYFASTAGGAPLETVKRYIQNQKRPD